MLKQKRRLRVFSRHPSHQALRDKKILLPTLTMIRLGSTSDGTMKYDIEINSAQGIINSSSKKLMKECFDKSGIKTASWIIPKTVQELMDFVQEMESPVVAKTFHGSRGEGNTLLKNVQEVEEFIKGKNVNNLLFEKFYSYNREYRLHCTSDGVFYTCRKMLKKDTPEKNRWYRNDSNCTWILETNPAFEKPSNWKEIEAECVKALKSLDLDIAGFDVKVQNERKDGSAPNFIIIESNSACSHAEITVQKYAEVIPKVYENKKKNKPV
jgi:glutathione synthase/RimK-type ligase-like ATP-grasp enzyme